MKPIVIFISLLFFVFLGGCYQSTHEKQKVANTVQMIVCPKERPMMCPNDGEPVCGVLNNGGTWDYESACLACSRRIVMGYLEGSCPR